MRAAEQPVMHPAARLDLSAIVRTYRRSTNSHDADDSGGFPIMGLTGCPVWLAANVRRAIHYSGFHGSEDADASLLIERPVSTSEEEAMSALLLHSINDFDYSAARRFFGSLRRAIHTLDLGSDDFKLINEWMEGFKFELPAHEHNRRRRNIRCAGQVHARNCAIATDLGIAGKDLAQILIVDSLRRVEGVAMLGEMTRACDDFHRAVAKRARVVAAILDAVDCPLPDEVQELRERVRVELAPEPRAGGKKRKT